MNAITIFSPATVANVSCAFDVMGFAVENAGDRMIFRKTKEKGVRLRMKNFRELPVEPEKNVAGVVALAMLKKADPDFGISIEMEKGILPGSGMGSSGASAGGAAFGVNQLLGEPFDQNELIGFAMLGEALASGVAHADNVAPNLFGGFALVRSTHPLDVIPLPVPDGLSVSLIHPLIEVKTQNARNILKKSILLKDAVTQWGNVAALTAGLFTGDFELIARSMHDGIVEPVRSMLIPKFDELKQAALNAGALGCSISGSGPSVFALSADKETAEKVTRVMYEIYQNIDVPFETFTSGIASSGCRVIHS
ncbi:homoserine kinase [Candidatus Sulfidibacterium hydrothermale]|uniref:homoserine kinase n=1 Tax=Candidatus Sulfidibacterium hydrothermale TaxID=2875962 RepID=UPI001F0A7F40|nr:homoserine kinase [Candidatus Sulfidibacterium hydrothermale]UBM61684.1 homoserine kinase [Candidatus Sulfidibacterium hydrothermale]